VSADIFLTIPYCNYSHLFTWLRGEKKRDITLVKVRSTVVLVPSRDISSYLVDNLGIHLVCRYITTAGNGCQTFFSFPANRFVRIYSTPAMDKYRPI